MAKSTGEMFYNPYKEFKRRRNPSKGDSQSTASSEEPASLSTTTSRSDQSQKQSSGASTNQSNSDQNRDPFQTAGNMAGAGLKGFGKFSSTYLRGVIVDIPHAAAEGFRRAPQLYGEKPKDYGTVHNWKSGMAVGGKNFVGGMTGGLSGLVTHPLKGLMEEGPSGAARGLARGAMGAATKMPSGEWFPTPRNKWSTATTNAIWD